MCSVTIAFATEIERLSAQRVVLSNRHSSIITRTHTRTRTRIALTLATHSAASYRSAPSHRALFTAHMSAGTRVLVSRPNSFRHSIGRSDPIQSSARHRVPSISQSPLFAPAPAEDCAFRCADRKIVGHLTKVLLILEKGVLKVKRRR